MSKIEPASPSLPDDSSNPVSSPIVCAIESAAWGQNCYIAYRSERKDAVVFDPGNDAGAILSELSERGLQVAAILLTHGHHDHISGVDAVKAAYPNAPIVIGRNEAHLLGDPAANLSRRWGLDVACAPADRLIDEGERIEYAGLGFEVREIPGHSSGSVVYIFDSSDVMLVFAGDVLFQGSIGRFDFPGGDGELLIKGIRAKLLTLPDRAIVLPGHGERTTIGDEREWNPFLRGDVLA